MWDLLIINPFTNVLLTIYNYVGSFGIAIILFTLLIRLITHPLTVQQLKGSTAMQELNKNKRWIEAQEKYKNDKEKLAQEQMAIYKELGINPVASCLPTLIQFPIIIGLYQSVVLALGSSPMDLFNLTQKIYPGFLRIENLIPLKTTFLWIQDLGQPDWLHIPGLPFGIPILMILVVITTYVQSKLLTPPAANPNDQSAMMGNMMNIYMPFLMGYLALTLSSGLSLYFVVSNLIGIGQYALLGKADWSNLLPKRAAAASKPATRKSKKEREL
jgi:YidC/Oxa1 family membrane protein insertase